ncbi:MAG TPA: response regulator [Steroidobacteraceae bacterium]|nr:response regulator [Steroidobacteraceae bacterium]
MDVATGNEMKQRPYVVLHVEDDGDLAASLAALLRVEGFVPLTAADGPGALARVAHAAAPPDLLVMDLDLHSDMDGTDVAEELCHAIGHVVPTIFLSGELANAGLPWLPGAPLLFIAKPADPEVLLKAIESFAVLGRFLTSHAQH